MYQPGRDCVTFSAGNSSCRRRASAGAACDRDLVAQLGTNVHGTPRPTLVTAGTVPAVHRHAGVVLAAQQQVGVADRTRGGRPTVVADDRLRAAVGQFHDKLHEQAGVAAVVLPLAAEAQIAGVPAVAENRADGVLAGLEELRHVVGLIVDPLAEIGPARRQFILADAPAVEVQLVAAQGRDVDLGMLDRLRDLEGLAKVGGVHAGDVVQGRRAPGRALQQTRPQPTGRP